MVHGDMVQTVIIGGKRHQGNVQGHGSKRHQGNVQGYGSKRHQGNVQGGGAWWKLPHEASNLTF